MKFQIENVHFLEVLNGVLQHSARKFLSFKIDTNSLFCFWKTFAVMEADRIVFTGTSSKAHYQVYSGTKQNQMPYSDIKQNQMPFL